MTGSQPIVEARDLHYTYRTDPSGLLGLGGRRKIPALTGVNLTLAAGRVTGLLGDSGSGKSTLALVLSGNLAADRGELLIAGQSVQKLGGHAKRRVLRKVGLVPQFAAEALQQDQSVARQFKDRLRRHGLDDAEAQRRIDRALEQVRLPARFADRTPGSMSGGERQRVAIARALSQGPRLLVLDEPVAAVDVRLQEALVEMLLGLRGDGMALLWISHDIGGLRRVSEDLAIMYRGQVVEQGAAAAIWARPVHPYTQVLLAPDQATDQAPDPLVLPSGCPFHPLCKFAQPSCNRTVPNLRHTNDRLVACSEVSG